MPALAHLRPGHDETLIARLAAEDLLEPEAREARVLVASCPACAELETDLRSIMAATATLPTPRRTRDFRLTDADAARLRRTGWRRLVGRFGDPRLAFTRPLATGLVTLGIAGLVFAAAPSFLSTIGAGGAASALAPTGGDLVAVPAASGLDSNAFGPAVGQTAPGGDTAIPGSSIRIATLPPESGQSPAASVAYVGASAGPPGAGTLEASGVPPAPSAPVPASASANPQFGTTGGGTPSQASVGPVLDQNLGVGKSATGEPSDSGVSTWLIAISVVLLAGGLGLFVLRWLARRPT